MALIALAVGAGFLVAALFQGPAAADGTRSGSGHEPHRQIGGLVEPVARLITVAERPSQERQQAAGADDRRHDRPRAPLAGTIGGVVAPRDATPSTGPRRSAGASPVSVPLPRVGASVPPGAAERERLRPVSVARATHRPASSAGPSRLAADPPQPPATAATGVHGLADSPAVALITAPLPSVVDTVSAVTLQPVAMALRPVAMALFCVADVVLPPAVGAVIVPAAASPLPAPPALGPAAVPVTDPAPVPTVPTPSADSTVASVRAAALPIPAAPPPISVVGPARSTASTGHLAARPGPVAAGADLPGRPVAPVDQDAAGVDDGSTPGPGLVWPVDRQSHVGPGQPCDLVPLLSDSRTPSVIARPG
ncbi:hypothetical protein C7C45_03350 [Micromonospora arborensis]|uniref:Uncharacterized protein n=1 Tax=Micromonospora arborensis TaxID=2116518 RepID=A0A318NUI6_9ACTN|nr:hypothetical protein C7C45_03350 [Micromonospora arborensis]